MIVFGAKGFAKQLLPTLANLKSEIIFLDQDRSISLLYKYPIIHDLDVVDQYFLKDNQFTLGVGNPRLRKRLSELLESKGGQLTGLQNQSAIVSDIETHIQEGVQLLQSCIVESFVSIGRGTLLNIGAKVCHDSRVGAFCEIGPNVTITGGCTIGDGCSFGASSTVIPNLRIGNNVTVGAGAVVINDIPDNCVVVGVPAKIIKEVALSNLLH
jgi:sugar O-acyltransferase (sialic acid O-acetyltransferase NeuD family)